MAANGWNRMRPAARPDDGRRSLLRAAGRPLVALLALGLLPAAAPLRAQPLPDSLGLDELARLAWASAPLLDAARAADEAGRLSVAESVARRLPRLDLDARAGWVSEVQELSLPTGSLSFGDGRSADLAVVGSWTLVSGGRLAAVEDAARAEARARGHERRADSLALAAELRERFVAALAADAALEAARTALARLERHLADLDGRVAAGLAGEDERLQARARLARARREEALGAGAREQARLELGRLAGRPDAAPVPLGDLTRPLAGLEPPAPERLDAQLALEARADGAEARRREAAGARRPRLDLQAGWHFARPGVDPIANDWMDYGSAALVLRWPLWDNRAGRMLEDRARVEGRRAEAGLAESERRLSAARAAARAARTSAAEAARQAADLTALEARRLELMQGRWREGLATERDWLDAHDDLRLAEIDERLALARLRQAESRLLAALGR